MLIVPSEGCPIESHVKEVKMIQEEGELIGDIGGAGTLRELLTRVKDDIEVA